MLRYAFSVCCMAVVVASAASANDIEVIYTEIAGSPTAVVPGAKDAVGDPAFAEWSAIEDLSISPDGAEWMVKGRTNQGSSLDSILVLGAGTSGNAFAQDGQPFQGGVTGELYDFFDSPGPASWNELGEIGFSARARGGDSAVFEKVVTYIGGVHTIVLQMGDDALGLVDNPVGSSGDEKFGNSIASVFLLNDGATLGFVNTPITNCHSSRYPAFFMGDTSFRQSGISPIDGEVWDSFGLSDAGGTPDGAHWFAEGDTENANTAIDLILAVDDDIVLQEGSPVAGSGVTLADIFFTRMLTNGDWFSRGDDPSDNDWAVRNGVLVAKTGDEIAAGEHWTAVFSAFTGNRLGDWLLAGSTDIGDANTDNVLTLNGTLVLAREGDALDVDGDGSFDDDAFIASFQPNDMFLTDDMKVYMLLTLRNSAGSGIGDAFVRLAIPSACNPCDTNCDGSVNGFDIDPLVELLTGGGTPCSSCAGDVNADGSVNGFDVDGFVAALSGGSC
ncbi:MAG: hypothetical protein CHACPFDD_01790 [Phycisphaerae bacterium]|nr:hypothetical protein [Phycisphaerae bacterium]